MKIITYDSPNKYIGRKNWIPDIIVCHITEGSYNSALNWLLNPKSKVSSNFLVGRDGTVAQLVDIKNGAWCNGTSTSSKSNVYYKKATNKIVNSRSINANYYTISIEFEGIHSKTKGALSKEQLSAAIELIKWIKEEVYRIYKKELIIDRAHLIGHYEVNPITKPFCPGELFPFDKIINAVTKSSIITTPFEIGTIIYPKKDITLLSNAGYTGATKWILPMHTKCIVDKYHSKNGLYMALKDENNKYFKCAWTNEFNEFLTSLSINGDDIIKKLNDLLAKKENEIKELNAKLNTFKEKVFYTKKN